MWRTLRLPLPISHRHAHQDTQKEQMSPRLSLPQTPHFTLDLKTDGWWLARRHKASCKTQCPHWICSLKLMNDIRQDELAEPGNTRTSAGHRTVCASLRGQSCPSGLRTEDTDFEKHSEKSATSGESGRGDLSWL